jgi:hypothetical protein
LAGVLLAAGPAGAAVNRVFTLTPPASAVVGSKVNVSVVMSTDAGEGERIAFLQAEYSIDGGRTWIVCWMEDELGTSATRQLSFSAGPAGSKALVRARVAFRGGVAGAVDCEGAAIRWYDTWKQWREPPAKSTLTAIVAS